jgi:hypothetical protein
MKINTGQIITLIGLVLLIAGIIAAFIGPVEMYCYSLFTEGGRFHYEGFSFGSMIFGSITMQIWAYYIIALICIPLGYGHVKKHAWIQKISLALLWSWFIVGIPILPILFFIFITNKEPSVVTALLSAAGCVLSYTLLPVLLIKFYNGKNCAMALNQGHDSIKTYPLPLIVLLVLYAFSIYSLHVLLLYRGIFPFFGDWLFDLKGIILISILISFILLLIIGTLKRKVWSWWASLFYFCSFTLSLIVTFLSTDFSEIIALLHFPPTETNMLIKIPLKGIHLGAFFGIPLLMTLAVIVSVKKYFMKKTKIS